MLCLTERLKNFKVSPFLLEFKYSIKDFKTFKNFFMKNLFKKESSTNKKNKK